MIQILLITVLSLLAQLVLPWWSLAIVTFLVCYWRGGSAGRAFLYSFAGIALVWLTYALFIHLQTDGVFTGRMGELLFKSANAALPLLATTILGGLVGGLGGLSGFFVRQAAGNKVATRTNGRANA